MDKVIGGVCSRQEEKYISVTFLGTDEGKKPSLRRRRRRKYYVKMDLKKWSARHEMDSTGSCYSPVAIPLKP
jgi:hypothetical protein